MKANADLIETKQDKLEAGPNITIINNTISAKDTTYDVATQSANGLMSSADKKKLDGIVESTDLSLAFNESTNSLTVTVNGTSQTVTLYSSAEGGSY